MVVSEGFLKEVTFKQKWNYVRMLELWQRKQQSAKGLKWNVVSVQWTAKKPIQLSERIIQNKDEGEAEGQNIQGLENMVWVWDFILIVRVCHWKVLSREVTCSRYLLKELLTARFRKGCIASCTSQDPAMKRETTLVISGRRNFKSNRCEGEECGDTEYSKLLKIPLAGTHRSYTCSGAIWRWCHCH